MNPIRHECRRMSVAMNESGKKANRKQSVQPPAFDPRLGLPPQRFEISSLENEDDDKFELKFMEEVLQRDPCNEDALMLLGHTYTRRGEFQKGLDMDASLVRLRPGDPTAYYNLACSYSLLLQIDEALAALNKAMVLGYRDIGQMMADADLANLRRDPRFRKLIGRFLKRSANKT